MILQLDPYIPVSTAKGGGFAVALIDYGADFDTLWKVIITQTSEVWDIPQPEIRGIKNISMGRTGKPTAFKHGR